MGIDLGHLLEQKLRDQFEDFIEPNPEEVMLSHSELNRRLSRIRFEVKVLIWMINNHTDIEIDRFPNGLTRLKWHGRLEEGDL
jgi:hypothetical protein